MTAKPTEIPANYSALEEITIRELTDAIRTPVPLADAETQNLRLARISQLTATLKTVTECMGTSFNIRHFAANQGIVMQQQAAQALQGQGGRQNLQ